MATGLEILPFVKIEWVKPLWKKLNNIRGSQAQELDRLRDEFVDPEELARFYVQPHTQDRNPANEHQDGLLSVARQPAFERVNEFFQGDPPLEKDGRHQMFILSDAGMGKTSLLLMIKLMHLIRFWPPGYNCELLKLGDDTMDKVAAMPDKGDTVLLLDALDEDRQAWQRIRERLLDLLHASEDFRRVIISSRTQFFPDMEPEAYGRSEIRVLDGYHCPVLYLSPFNDQQVNEFIEKKIPLHWSDQLCFRAKAVQEERERAHHLIRQMDSLRMRPMLLVHIDKLLAVKEEETRIWNGYTVYDALMEKWLDREVRKLRKQHRNTETLPRREDLLIVCIRVAEWMQRQGVRVISRQELECLISADGVHSWLEKFQPEGRSLLNRNSDMHFRFSHYTIQEFLLAYGIVNDMLTGHEPLRATDQLVRFVSLTDDFQRCWQLLDCTGFNWTGYVEIYGPVVYQDRLKDGKAGPVMLILSGGSFRMGDMEGNGNDNEQPVHEVRLDSFAIGRYPVTFEEFDVFCAATDRQLPDDAGWGRGHCPVINVSYEDADAYCTWLSRETVQEYRLPTEAEWEYACRAGSEAAYCFGNAEKQLAEYGWYEKNSGKQPHHVGEKQANEFGIHDMHGNVWEWCADCYDGNFYAESPADNPVCLKRGANRVFRGGSWIDGTRGCRSAYRNRLGPGLRDDDLGFRCCARVQGEPGRKAEGNAVARQGSQSVAEQDSSRSPQLEAKP